MTSRLFLLVSLCTAMLITGCNHQPDKVQENHSPAAPHNRKAEATKRVESVEPVSNTSPPRRPDINSYTRTCTTDDECTVVTGWGMCGCSDLCAAAIHRDDVARFNADLASMSCGDYVDPACKAADACPMVDGTHCDGGTCKVRYLKE